MTVPRERPPLAAALHAPIREALPEADPARAVLLGEGYGVIAYRLPAPGGDRVVRVPKPQSWWAVEDLEREVRLLPLIESAPFETAVPREAQLLRDAEGAVIAALHRMVPGEPATAGQVRGRAARERLARDIGRFLSTLHAIPAAEARNHGAREQDLWRDEYRPLIESALPHLGPRTRAWLERSAEAFARCGGTEGAPRVLIHGDLSGHHLLVDEAGGLSGVIDFADALVADPALDFAGVLNHFAWPVLERVWWHYRGPLDADAARRARFYIAVAPLYQVIHGATALGQAEREAGRRSLAARAAAATRRSGERSDR